LAGIVTLHVIVALLGTEQELTFIAQLGLLIDTTEFALNPVPVMVAVNVVPAVHDAGVMLVILTGWTRVK